MTVNININIRLVDSILLTLSPVVTLSLGLVKDLVRWLRRIRILRVLLSLKLRNLLLLLLTKRNELILRVLLLLEDWEAWLLVEDWEAWLLVALLVGLVLVGLMVGLLLVVHEKVFVFVRN